MVLDLKAYKTRFLSEGKGKVISCRETKDRKGTEINSAKYGTRIWKVRLLKAVRRVQVCI